MLLANQATGGNFDLNPWAQFGLGGVVIGALFAYIIYMSRQHASERRDYREDIKEIAAKHDATNKETTDKFVSLHEKTLDAIRRQ